MSEAGRRGSGRGGRGGKKRPGRAVLCTVVKGLAAIRREVGSREDFE